MATVFGVVEDLKFKISECSDQNWCFPDSAQLAVSAKLRQLTGQVFIYLFLAIFLNM